MPAHYNPAMPIRQPPKPRPDAAASKPAAKKLATSKSAQKRAVKARSPADIRALFKRFRAHNPEPKGELQSVNAYTLLVAVVLSAQATDVGVNKATRPLFSIADTPQKMVALGEDVVRDYVKSIGLFRTKAKNIIALSEQLIAEHGGEVPGRREALEKLPGVGRKTANVVLNMAFGQITHAVDTHVFRIANRLRIAPGRNPLQVELGLEKAVPEEFGHHAHHWLILHGRYTCKAVKPLCAGCIVADLCDSADKRMG
jgi:endonuclease-3